MGNRNVLTEAFSAAVSIALRDMAGIESVQIAATAVTGSPPSGEVTSLLTLTVRTGGFLALSMPWATASTLTRRILAETPVLVDDTMVRDCVGEVANIVAGQAKTLLYGTPDHFSFSSPQTVGIEVLPTADWLVLSFGSDAGDLTLNVNLPA